MKKLLSCCAFLVISAPAFAQLNCSGGTLACSTSVVMTGGATTTMARLGLGAAADATYQLNLNGGKVHGVTNAVGVNTTAPVESLTVQAPTGVGAFGVYDRNGSAMFKLNTDVAGGTSTAFFNGINLTLGQTANASSLLSVNGTGAAGYVVHVASGTSRFNGLVGIGMAPVNNLDVTGTIGTTSFISINTSGSAGTALRMAGTVRWTGGTAESVTGSAICIAATSEVQTNAAATCTVSSLRFKDWIEDLTCIDAERIINGMRPAVFRDKGATQDRFGFAAEWTADVEPRLVNYEADGTTPRAVDYERYTAVLTKAMQCGMVK